MSMMSMQSMRSMWSMRSMRLRLSPLSKPVSSCAACVVAFIALLTTGCASTSSTSSSESTPTIHEAVAVPVAADSEFATDAVMLAHYTSTPVKLDGKLDEEVWQNATTYPLHVIRKANVPSFPLQENGVIRLAWDDDFFYVAGQFEDVDIIDNAKADQQFLYSKADTMELFLKPSTRRWYWEFYGTPREHKTTLFYPSRGRFGLSPYPFQHDSGHRVASSFNGTLNNWSDRDQGYIVEMAIPRKELDREGQGMTEANPQNKNAQGKPVQWSILVARYNHSAYAETFQSELSTTPALKLPNFHIYETWAKLQLVK